MHCLHYEFFNTLRPGRNEQHFADDIFKCIFFNENVWVAIKISLKFIPKGPINNIPALVRIMAWRRSGDKPLSEPMMLSLPTHICVTRPQWVKMQSHFLTQYCVCLWSNLPQSFYDSQCMALIAVVKGEQLFESNLLRCLAPGPTNEDDMPDARLSINIQ